MPFYLAPRELAALPEILRAAMDHCELSPAALKVAVRLYGVLAKRSGALADAGVNETRKEVYRGSEMDARIYILMVPGWDEGEETRVERAFTSGAEAEAAAKAHPRKCAYVTEVSLNRKEV